MLQTALLALLGGHNLAFSQTPGDLPYPGDGTTPSFADHLAVVSPKTAAPKHQAATDARGGITWSTAIELPKALLQAEVQLAYNVSSPDRGLGPGFSLSFGPSVETPASREREAAFFQNFSAYDDPATVWRVSGSGLDGILQFLAPTATYQLISFDRPDGLATYDSGTYQWTVRSGLLSATLEPRLGNAPGKPAESWRPVRLFDTSGNEVKYSYTAGGDISVIEFGGNSLDPLAYPSTSKVEFIWTSRPSAEIVTSYAESLEDRFDTRLTEIRVLTRKVTGGGWYIGHSYELAYTDLDGTKVLSSIQRRGWNGTAATTTVVPVANFVWSDFDGGAGETVPFPGEGAAEPAPISNTYTASNAGADCGGAGEPYAHSEQYLTAINADFDGDGVLDVSSPEVGVVGANGGAFNGVMRTLRQGQHQWDDQVPNASPGALTGNSLGITKTRQLNPDQDITWTQVAMIDLDGDGLLDEVSALHDPGEPSFCPIGFGTNIDVPAIPSVYTWTVRYGLPGRSFSSAVTINAPAPWPTLSVSRSGCPTVEEMFGASGYWYGREVRNQQVVSTRDFTGDGWADVLLAAADDYLVAPRIPGRGKGFGLPYSILGSGQSELRNAMLSEAWEHASFDGDAESDAWGKDPDDTATSCGYADTSQKRGFHDINGDGLLDFVVVRGDGSDGSTSSGFDVFYGNGTGFAHTSAFWAVPSSGAVDRLSLSRTREVAGPVLPESQCGSTELIDSSVQEAEVHRLFMRREESEGVVSGAPTTDERVIPVSVCLSRTTRINYSYLEMALVDIDADGRPDLVESTASTPVVPRSPSIGGAQKFRWWRNLGSGFSSVRCSGGTCDESWLTGSLSKSVSESTAGSAGGSSFSFSGQRDLRVVTDLDGDGLLDVIDRSEGTATYQRFPRPYILNSVQNGAGLTSSFEWRRLTSVAPAGDLVGSDLPESGQRLEVLAAAETVDVVSGARARTERDYYKARAVAGKFVGFDSLTETVLEPRYLGVVGGQLTRSVVNGNTLWLPSNRTVSSYEHTRDRPLVVGRTIEFDERVATRRLATDAPLWRTKHQSTAAFNAVPSLPPTGCAALETNVVPRCRQVSAGAIEFVETSGNSQLWGSTTARGATVQSTWSGTGEMLTSTRSGDDIPFPDTTTVTWRSAGGLHVPVEKRIEARHPVINPNSTRVIERVFWTYDGSHALDPTQGLLTAQAICSERWDGSSPVDCSRDAGGTISGKAISWQFDRHDRGQVQGVYGVLGDTRTISMFRFGGTVPGIEQNGLFQESRAFVNDRGLLDRERDVGGVVKSYVYDSLGRVTEEWIRGDGGIDLLTRQVQYFDAVPRRVKTVEYLTDVTSGPKSETWQVFDGLGGVRQSWKRNAADNGYIVEDHLIDVFGQERFSTTPHPVSSFSTNLAVTTGATLLSEHQFDGLGRERQTWPDKVRTPLCTSQVHFGAPGVAVSLTPSGQIKRNDTDAFGRLVLVAEGYVTTSAVTYTTTAGVEAEQAPDIPCSQAFAPPSGTAEVIATYRYDGRDRLAAIEDGPWGGGDDHRWIYVQDRAGRPRVVRRSRNGQSGSDEFMNFAYDETNPSAWPIAQYEGAVDATAEVTWAYDALARVQTKQVQDPANPSQPWVHTWTWDTAFVGKLTSHYVGGAPANRPKFNTTFTYDAPYGVAGNLGRVGSETRAYTNAGVNPTATFAYQYNLRGDVTGTTWPSGRRVDTTFSTSGWKADDTVRATTGGAVLDAFSYAYDSYGLLQQANGGSGFTNSITRVSPATVSAVTMARPGGSDTLSYTWRNDGSPLTRTSTAFANGGLEFGYDRYGRVSIVRDTTASINAEEYRYDRVGNLLGHARRTLTDPTVPGVGTWSTSTWTYGSDPKYNQEWARSRTLPAGFETDTSAYDLQSRVTSRTLDRATAGGVNDEQRAFTYGGTGQLVRADVAHRAWNSTGAYSTTRSVLWAYDGDDELGLEMTWFGGQTSYQYWFKGWQQEVSGTGAVTVKESLLPMMEEVNGVRRYLLREPDGHALATYSTTGALIDREMLGAYGMEVRRSAAIASEENRFHGMELNRGVGLTRMGVRHLSMGDGQWLQPEPLLAVGPPAEMRAVPRTMFGSYGAQTATVGSDTSGYCFGPLAAGCAYIAKEVGTEAVSYALHTYAGPATGYTFDAATTLTSPRKAAGGVISTLVARNADDAAVAVGVGTAKGGTYGAVRAANVGGEVHHMPMKSALKDAGHPAGAGAKASGGPSILMETADHRALPSSQGLGGDLAAAQSASITPGARGLDEAFLLGAEEVQAIHGTKYDDAIVEAMSALP